MTALSVRGLAKSFGGLRVTRDVSVRWFRAHIAR